MPSIADTIRRFGAGKGFPVPGSSDPASARLEPLSSFGSNPGALAGWCYAPRAPGPLALVVVLHGCTQTAAGYDRGSGWSDLAERFGFAVLFPEQQRANNPNLCFNWFLPGDTGRDGGEALSIRQMVAAMAQRFPIDPARVFVTGLSAGGAMANVMLATYPELFAGGSIVAGLPYASATSVPDALERMRGVGHAGAEAAAERVRRASSHAGPWPRVAVWHGDADRTVDVGNADAIVGQWRVLHGVRTTPDIVDLVDGQRHRGWRGQDGGVALEEYRIAGMGHGTPLQTGGDEGCGVAGLFMLEAGISSTWVQARRWGLIGAEAAAASASNPAKPTPAEPTSGTASVAATIEHALRSAGLMR